MRRHPARTLHGVLLFAALLPAAVAAQRPALDPDDTQAAFAQLEAMRDSVRATTFGHPAVRARWLTMLGTYDEAAALLAEAPDDADTRTARAVLAARLHRYDEAEAHVRQALERDGAHRDARVMQARLHIQAWELDDAVRIAEELIAARAKDTEAALLIGRVRMLEKRYDDALAWADTVRAWDADNGAAWLLEAETRFWDQDPAGAEPALVRALELAPFDADARFAYGYAIWRRVDATQLDAMAAQWALALAADPLHYVTHWHWGNGHTNLTYADYAHPSDSTVRVRLKPADLALSAGRFEEALRTARAVQAEFPESVLPALLRGSAFYLAEHLPPAAALDSAQSVFEGVLARKPHYGPAHNGLAAVLKKRQFTYLAGYDSLEALVMATPLPDDARFFDVFSDARYYPGDRVLRMIRQQLGPTVGYVPMLHRQNRRFTIPPLHKDLAEAQDRPQFRYTTTFDNRQWMDIRGVGGGSTGIEYVERGAHQERNVLLHEYAHLFHGNVLTDAENRRIRALYHAAMETGRTLDYYAANNESEFFAQAWEAYTMPKKVHPLNHKSMNSRSDLETKDPELFAFIDSMAARLDAARAGDTAILRSNWAETYVNLSRSGGASDVVRTTALLDTALVWDDRYLPALVRYGSVMAGAGHLDEAETWLARAEEIDARYAPVQTAYAELAAARTRAGELDPVTSLEYRIAHYRRALELEDDLAERAALNVRLRQDLADHGLVPEAIQVAEQYALEGPTISTYLRDRRDEARAFALELRASAGHAERTLGELSELVAARPFNYTHRMQYANALAAAGRADSAIALLEAAQRVLRAAGQPRSDYAVRIAGLHAAAGRRSEAEAALAPVLARQRLPADPGLVRTLALLGDPDRAETVLESLESLPEPTTPAARGERALARAALLEARGDAAGAEAALRSVVGELPYHVDARLALLRLLVRDGRRDEGAALAESWPMGMMLPPGPDYRRRAGEILRGS